jgi:transposase
MQLLLNEGLPYTEMAKIFGCHTDTTRNWVMKLGLNVIEPQHKTSSVTVTKLQRIAKQEERKRQLEGDDKFETSPIFSRRIRHSD